MSITEETVRANFPGLNQDQVYLDNAGGSQTLGAVIDSIREYLSATNVQLGATYAVAKKSTALYNAAYEAGAQYVNAHADEIVYGPSTTQLFRNLSFSLDLKEGDEIVLTKLDHEANVAPWVDMADRLGLVVKWWHPEDKRDPRLEVKVLEGLLTPKTKFVAFSHVNNVIGTVHDVEAISKAAHKVGALVCVDGVAFAPHRALDMKQLGVDFYAFSWYKVYGPHMAMLYGSREALQHVKSLGHFFNAHATMTDKLELSSTSYEMAQGIPKIVEYLGAPGSERWQFVASQEEKLQTILLDYLRQRSDVTIYGVDHSDPKLRLPTISFTVRGWNSKKLVEAAEACSNYAFRWGAFYSDRLVRDELGLGEDGVVRVSFVHYNTVAEAEGLTKVLDQVLSKSPSQ